MKNESHKVTGIIISKHIKRGAPTSLRVEYKCGYGRTYSEWIYLEHTGYARDKAVKWWIDNIDGYQAKTSEEAQEYFKGIPNTIDSALKMEGLIMKPDAITVRQEEKYTRIISRTFPESDRAAPLRIGLSQP